MISLLNYFSSKISKFFGGEFSNNLNKDTHGWGEKALLSENYFSPIMLNKFELKGPYYEKEKKRAQLVFCSWK